MRATGKSRHQVNVSISIQLEFYYNEYDWGVIYREIGGQNNKFYKVGGSGASNESSRRSRNHGEGPY